MRKRTFALWWFSQRFVLAAGGFGIWLAGLPNEVAALPEAILASETSAVQEALRHSGDTRPVIAIIAINDATETTDCIASRSGHPTG